MQGGRAEGAYQEREQLLDTEASAAHAELAALVGSSFESLCDAKRAGGDVYYRLSNEKVGGIITPALYGMPQQEGILDPSLLRVCTSQSFTQHGTEAQAKLSAAGMCVQVLAWLRFKLRRLRAALTEHSAAHAAMDEASLTAYSVRLLGEYLPEPWLQRLCDACHVSAVPGVCPSSHPFTALQPLHGCVR